MRALSFLSLFVKVVCFTCCFLFVAHVVCLFVARVDCLWKSADLDDWLPGNGFPLTASHIRPFLSCFQFLFSPCLLLLCIQYFSPSYSWPASLFFTPLLLLYFQGLLSLFRCASIYWIHVGEQLSNVFEICSNLEHIFRACSEYVQSMYRVSSEYVQSMFRVCSEFVQSGFRVRSEWVQSRFRVVSE